jgi:broad specificity phosphatase PhoE
MKKAVTGCILIILLVSCSTSHYCYIVRHAEKADSTITAELSSLGHQRALALRDSLINKNITTIFATTIHGTQETAKPLAEASHKTVQIYNYNAVDSIVRVIKNTRNKNILVVDHRGTMPAIIVGLTGQKINTPPVIEYDNLYVIETRRGKSQLSQKKYGVINKL